MKTALVTGVTGAISKATALELARHDCQLILLGRNEAKLSQAKGEIEEKTGNHHIDIVVADLSEPKQIQREVELIKQKYTSINALINIAAIFRKQP